MKKKIEEQLNKMLAYVRTCNLTENEHQEIGKIAFLYSVNRMSPLEVTLRLWYVAHHNVDGIYEKDFQNFMQQTTREN